ncbi:MAG TPA: nucleotidyltransferase domain-containing protein [Thermoanaerobaculia bacterium]|nr:nucleotidyltransferase domain-containing protein [Thermoanaerobaculia bacterium]
MNGEGAVAADPRLTAEVAEHSHPLLFATVSGAHLYGFPSPDSDFDLRGSHVLSVDECLGLSEPAETITLSHVRDGLEVDLVTHDARKFFTLLLRNNGYVLEQLYSPLVVFTTWAHQELKEIARGCITRRCLRHYRGFARNQWEMFARESPRRIKTLLYVYRVLLTGIHMMRTGEVEGNLLKCNADMGLSFIDDLVARKMEGAETSALSEADLSFHQSQVRELQGVLADAASTSRLPQEPTVRPALNDLLLRIRREWPAGRTADSQVRSDPKIGYD